MTQQCDKSDYEILFKGIETIEYQKANMQEKIEIQIDYDERMYDKSMYEKEENGLKSDGVVYEFACACVDMDNKPKQQKIKDYSCNPFSKRKKWR